MNIYPVNTLIQLNVTFLGFFTNAPIDPSAVNVFIQDPSGNETEFSYPGPVSRTSTGIYFYQFVPNATGKWTYKWQGTGAVVASSPDTCFVVKLSALLAPV